MKRNEKAGLLLLVFVLTPLVGWTALGFPVDNLSLGALASAVLAGVVSFAKVMLSEDKTSKSKKGKKSGVGKT